MTTSSSRPDLILFRLPAEGDRGEDGGQPGGSMDRRVGRRRGTLQKVSSDTEVCRKNVFNSK